MAFAMAAMAVAGQAQDAVMDRFIDSLMHRMTLREKIGQLTLLGAGDIVTGSAGRSPVEERIANGELGGVFNLKGVDKISGLQRIAVEQSRLGIPLIVGMDVIHGYETVFPIPLAMSCSWDTLAIERAAAIAATEASADGVCWTYSPMVDISVDPRWGRVAEGSGEDPYLGSCIARAMVRGYQGDLGSPCNIMACVKHFALYGAVEAGRDYNTVDMSRVRMYNRYFPPYRAAVEAGAGSVMTSFNLVDGIPATGNRWLLTDVLRRQWGFTGFVVTDYESLMEMTRHGMGAIDDAAVMALKAGTDMEMCSDGYYATLEQSLGEGRVCAADIDSACRRVLEAKYRLGLFANPYKYCDPARRDSDVYNADNRAAARDLAAETFVLLKNDGDLLPLKREGKIALIGPLADNSANLCGTWCVAATTERYATLRHAMERAMDGRGEVLYAQGCNLTRDAALQKASEFGKVMSRGNDSILRAEALDMACRADVIVCAMGECSEMSGESSSRADLEMPDVQRELLADLLRLGKPVVLLNFSGRPTVLTWEQAHVPAIMNVWFGGSEAGDAICDVLFGDKVPSGKLTMTMPQAVGQIPIYYNHLNTGRPVPEGAKEYRKFQSNYLDVRNDPLYPFGYGLSYTTFEYSDPELSADSMAVDGSVTVTVSVTNTGLRDADEVVQLYIRDLVARVSRPVKELKGFRRVHIKAGETVEVVFSITPDMLKYYDGQLDYGLDPGEFHVMTGPDSRRLKRCALRVY